MKKLDPNYTGSNIQVNLSLMKYIFIGNLSSQDFCLFSFLKMCAGAWKNM